MFFLFLLIGCAQSKVLVGKTVTSSEVVALLVPPVTYTFSDSIII